VLRMMVDSGDNDDSSTWVCVGGISIGIVTRCGVVDVDASNE